MLALTSVIYASSSISDRVRAGFLHLAVSLFIAAIITIPVILWLYPNPFFEAAGGLKLFVIILTVDICIGPLLTFFVFDKRKKSLCKDLGFVVALQIAALIYGAAPFF
jgi:hypothetical protein